VPNESPVPLRAPTLETDFDPHAVPIRDAVTVVLIRDAVDGIEVLMLKRSMRASFVPGAFVFPGGALDQQDYEMPPVCWLVPASDAIEASEHRVNVAGALRECFEETGILAGASHRGEPLHALSPELAALRREVHANRCTFARVLIDHQLRIDPIAVRYWSRWVTPVGSPRRFDTRFLVARAPREQAGEADGSELTESRWIRPVEALAGFAAGTIPLIFPTVKTLESLQVFRAVDEIF
jgi:8-oxo-dGTP pyrophosphatase MutT (NUDIX family)